MTDDFYVLPTPELKQAAQACPLLRRRQRSLGDAHNRISQIRITGSSPLHLTVSDSGLILG